MARRRGTRGDDHLIGTSGRDYIDGRDGDDTIIGGPGDDTIDGCSGNDYIKAGSGDDTVTDDRLDVFEFGFTDLADLLGAADDGNGANPETVISLDPDDSVTLIGIQKADLHDDDFLFWAALAVQFGIVAEDAVFVERDALA